MQLTLEGKKIDELAIELIQAVVGNKTAYVTLSGGKDSTDTVDLVRRSGISHELHYHRTGLDAPETIRFGHASAYAMGIHISGHPICANIERSEYSTIE